MRRFFSSILEVLEVAIIAIAAVFLIRSFLVQPFLVSGESMAPNFSDGDYLLIDELTYRFRSPERGEVIVFRNPTDTSVYFIKRLIALPGERIEIKDGRVIIYNPGRPGGFEINESYLTPNISTSGNVDLTLGQSEYFMLGDNRLYSFDSRSWRALPGEDIVGLVRLRLWPLDGVRAFAAPQY